MLKHFKTFARNLNISRKSKLGDQVENGNTRSLKMCKKCYTFYYKNSWHFNKPKDLDEEDGGVVSVKFMQCPACLEEELSLYNMEGLVA